MAPEAEAITTLFMHDGEQAVRLPAAFRLPGERVRVRRALGGAVVLEPIAPPAWPAGYWERLAALAAAAPLPDDALEMTRLGQSRRR